MSRATQHHPNQGDSNTIQASSSTDLPSIQRYHVLYYKQTRKVHKSKGVSKSDGIVSINTATDVVALFDQNQDDEQSTHRPLYSSSNHAIAKRWHNLENEENIQLGGYELDIVSKLTPSPSSSVEPGQSSVPAIGFNATPAVTTASKPRQRMILTQKRPLSSTHRALSLQPIAKVTRTVDRPTSTIALALRNTDAPPSKSEREVDLMKPTSNAPLSRQTTTNNSVLQRNPPRQPLRLLVRKPRTLPANCEAEPAVHELESNTATSAPPPSSSQLLATGAGAAKSQISPPPTSLVRTIRRVAVPLRSMARPVRSTAVGRAATSLSANNAPVQPPLTNPPTMSSATNTTSSAATNTSAAATASASNECTTILSHIVLPPKVCRVLRPHQIAGVNFLHTALLQHGGAILADEPGLGKTLMTIAIVAALHRQHRHKHFCVVCPSSLVNNWVKEFDQWLGKEAQPKRIPLKKGDTSYNSSSMKSFLLSKTGQVVILSYELFRLHSHHFVGHFVGGGSSHNSPSFALLVVDEGHRLKNTSGSLTLSALKELPCDARLLLSATIIQNNLGEFYTLANFCRPGVLGDMNEFRRRFEKPILARQSEYGCICPAQQELDEIASTFMLRRLQRDVLKSMLPPRSEALLFCRPSSRQSECYQEIVSSSSIDGTNGKSSDALAALTSLRKVCSHPLLYESNDHAETLLHPSSEVDSWVGESGKMAVLKALLQSIRHNGDASKVVIVSNFTSTLTLVESLILKPLGYTFLRLDGSTSADDRQSMVDRFNKHNVFCFLLSSKAGGCGLNLIGANRLILLDPSWNPADDIQAMGRIYRQGQTRETFIYRFFTSGTIEEAIYQRQLQKGHLANIIDKKSASFSRDEIKECFTLKSNCDCETKQKMGKIWPDYSGESGLRDLGCTDVPLLEIAKSVSSVLGWVHLACEQGEMTQSVYENPQSSQRSMYDSGNEEEFELEMDLEKNHGASLSTMSRGESSESEAEFEI